MKVESPAPEVAPFPSTMIRHGTFATLAPLREAFLAESITQWRKGRGEEVPLCEIPFWFLPSYKLALMLAMV